MALLCVVTNCGEGMDYKAVGKIFAGLAQCGAWGCFDEFNRIDVSVLSVISSQLGTIRNALRLNLKRFQFEGSEISLDSRVGIFITMNPGLIIMREYLVFLSCYFVQLILFYLLLLLMFRQPFQS